MRFAKTARWPGFTDTSRKRAALRRRQRLEREKLPLFADMVAAEQPSEDEVMAARAERWEIMEEEQRAAKAAKWREARARLNSLGGNLRAVVLDYWNQHRWLPGEPGYLLDLVHQVREGRMVVHDDGRLVYPENLKWPSLEECRRRMAAIDWSTIGRNRLPATSGREAAP